MSKDIFKKLSKAYDIDERVVSTMCGSPFRYTRKVMADDEDLKDIRFPYLFKLRVRKKYKNQDGEKLSEL